VAADALRAVARHDADRERARDRHEDDERPEMVTGRRDERRVEALKEEEIREQPDQLEQRRRDVRGKDANQNRERGNRNDAGRGREVTEIGRRAISVRHGSRDQVYTATIRARRGRAAREG